MSNHSNTLNSNQFSHPHTNGHHDAACGCGHPESHSPSSCQTAGNESAGLSAEGGCACGHDHAHTHSGEEDCECGGHAEEPHAHGGSCGCGDTHGHTHDDGCGCGHDHNHDASDVRTVLLRVGGTAVLTAAAMFLSKYTYVSLICYLLAYLLIGYDIVISAVKNLFKGKMMDENFLMALASIGAFLIGEHLEGIAVMAFYQVGEMFQGYAVGKSRKSIQSLLEIRPDYANVKRNGSVQTVPPEQVVPGDIIVVKPGEKVPLDGIVISGSSSLDTSALTGESLPRDVEVDSNVISGCINLNGVLEISVSKSYGESTISKILDMVENASAKKAVTENFITKFARYYTPIVVAAAALLAVIPPLVIGGSFSDWLYRALSFLVVSCPCALVISVPLSFFGGIGGASRQGILVKGSNYLEALAKTETVVFDKTGTLTKGNFHVSRIIPNGISEQELLRIAAIGESMSNHPISKSIVRAYGEEIPNGAAQDYREIAGHGVSASIDGKTVLLGNLKLMNAESVPVTPVSEPGSIVYVAVNGSYAGCIVISDEIKADSAQAIQALHQEGVRKTVMLTGDSRLVAESVAEELKLDEVHAELLPDGKVRQMERLMKEKEAGTNIAFAGDGVNDAPVLAIADIGVAMGGLGSDAAIEAADIVIMNDEPSKIASAIRIAKRTIRIVKQNIIFALGVKVIVLVLAAFGISGMWEAVFADVGVSLLAILNASRALRVKGL